MQIEKVCVIGLGYIGLPTAAVLAVHGVEVHGVDVNQFAIDTINAGKIHITEPELDVVVQKAVSSGKLTAHLQPAKADIFVIAVPTPFLEGDAGQKIPDLSYVKAACDAIAPFLQKGNLVILESTSPVGATAKLSNWLGEARSDLSFPNSNSSAVDVNVAHCPERVLPGQVVREIVENDRIIGGLTEQCTENAKIFYEIFVKGACLKTNAQTAEMSKLTENAFRDVNIAFANELSLLCDDFNIDVWELISLANRHPRVDILQPGPGVGGHCIAVDPWFIVDSAPEKSRLIRTAREVNDSKPHYVVEKVKAACFGKTNPTIACLGLAFKADIDDLRESPSVEIVKMLSELHGVNVLAVEPNIAKLVPRLQKDNIRLCGLRAACDEADVVVILVNHREFLEFDFDGFEGEIVDTRGIVKRSILKQVKQAEAVG